MYHEPAILIGLILSLLSISYERWKRSLLPRFLAVQKRWLSILGCNLFEEISSALVSLFINRAFVICFCRNMITCLLGGMVSLMGLVHPWPISQIPTPNLFFTHNNIFGRKKEKKKKHHSPNQISCFVDQLLISNKGLFWHRGLAN